MTTRLVLGTMNFATTVDARTSMRLLDQFVDAGGEWIDTADCYAFWASSTGRGGDSEALLGRWLRARPGMRERVRIASKFGAEPREPGSWPHGRTGLSRAAVRAQHAASLRRLGTDHLDLAWTHMEDRATAWEETVEALAELVVDGTTRRVGTSNHPAWRVERARAHAAAVGGAPVSALQHSYSYLQPRPGAPTTDHRFGWLDDELLDLAAEEHLDTWAYTPLLGGAYDNAAKPVPDAFDHPGNTHRLQVLTQVAEHLGVTRGQVVLAWLAGGQQPIRPILGGSKPEQLDAALRGVALDLPSELRARLDAVDPGSNGRPDR